MTKPPTIARNAGRIQPSLLERLTDQDRDATREVREQRASSARALRQSVMRDLGWLLNVQVLRPLTESGLNDGWVPTFTFDYSFER